MPFGQEVTNVPQRQSIPDWPLGDVLIELILAPIGNLRPPNTRIGNPQRQVW